MSALHDLLAKVEAGQLPRGPEIVKAFGTTRLSNGWDVRALIRWIMDPSAIEAMGAAKALHDAVLPGWGFCITQVGANVEGSVEAYDSDNINPARAWLIAILRALIAQGEEQDEKTQDCPNCEGWGEAYDVEDNGPECPICHGSGDVPAFRNEPGTQDATP